MDSAIQAKTGMLQLAYQSEDYLLQLKTGICKFAVQTFCCVLEVQFFALTEIFTPRSQATCIFTAKIERLHHKKKQIN